MPCSSSWRRCSSSSRRASRPPWILGWSVLTRPSRISGKPVSSATPCTGSPASAKIRWVPPVEIRVNPCSTKPRANSTRPVLSETLSNASFLLIDATPSSSNFDFPPDPQVDCLRIKTVLEGMNPFLQAVNGVVRPDGEGFLQDDRPRIHSFIDKMDGAAGHFNPVGQGIGDATGSGKSGQEGGVNIHNPVAESSHKFRRD